MLAVDNQYPDEDATLDRIVSFTNSLEYGDLPRDVVREATVRVIDMAGALIAGFDGEACEQVRSLARTTSGGRATILGSADKTSLDMAAFANAVAARHVEMMDVYHFPGAFGGHPSDVVMPVFSAAEQAGRSGRDLIAAVVLAYEIFLRFSDMFRNRGFDDTNFASIAVSAATAKLMRLGREGIGNAVAMAAVPSVILRQVRADRITMWKVLAAGYAGRAGVFAAQMAQAGIEGPAQPFSGTGGWIAQVSRQPLELVEWGGKGEKFKILDTRLKNRPTAGETISSALAAEKLSNRIADLTAVKRIKADLYHRALDRAATGAHHWNPRSRDAADHSIPYVIAAALRDGRLTIGSFDDAHLADPVIRSLIASVEVAEDKTFTATYPHDHRTRLTVELADGTILQAESGGDADDISMSKTDDQVSEKFTALVEPHLGKSKTRALLQRLWALEAVDNVAELPPLLRL